MAEDRHCATLSDFRHPASDQMDPEVLRHIKAKEEKLKKVLSPFEPVIMYMQGVLVWEKPGHSVIMLLCVNGVFWLVTTTNYRVVFMLAVTGIVVICIETWKNRVWPEITVEKHEKEEGWTPLHPRLLSVPELCHHLAETWVFFTTFCSSVWQMRKDQPGKFCMWVCCVCSVLAFVGHYIPGVMLSYIIMLSLLLWPVVEYHNVNQHIYNKLEPVWMQLEYSMMRNRRKRYSHKHGHTDNEMSFTAGLVAMPPHDESDMQESQDDLDLDSRTSISVSQEKVVFKPKSTSLHHDRPAESTSDMNFVSSHFDDSDHEVEKSLSHGLDFPDIEEVNQDPELSTAASSNLGAKTTDFVSQTVSAVMQGTYTALRHPRETFFNTTAGGKTETSKTTSDIDADLAGFEIMDQTELESYDEHKLDQTEPKPSTSRSYFDWLRKS
ncbi:reticulophagy regulator 3-like [Saccoglossus kowalevskii]|uniref:Protein FAM134C-like n=1 Tax=Saccoglossus kowalevskii TaxID=10224 RepID=A0ABM0M254_SACKO|nr:PREDICTED: protein FAM134C-like [Saccoglossus kowalevskii]